MMILDAALARLKGQDHHHGSTLEVQYITAYNQRKEFEAHLTKPCIANNVFRPWAPRAKVPGGGKYQVLAKRTSG